MIINNTMEKKQIFCENCGHNCHCGTKCTQKIINEFNEQYKIECCAHCRHRETEEKE